MEVDGGLTRLARCRIYSPSPPKRWRRRCLVCDLLQARAPHLLIRCDQPLGWRYRCSLFRSREAGTERVSVSSRWKLVWSSRSSEQDVRHRLRSTVSASDTVLPSPAPSLTFPMMVTSCPAWRLQVTRSGDVDAQMTGNSSSSSPPTGDGGAPNTDPDLIMGVSILGASCLALSSSLWSPGSSAKSAQPLVMSLSSIRTIMIVSPGPVLHALRTMPDLLLGERRAFIHLYRARPEGTAAAEEPHHDETPTA